MASVYLRITLVLLPKLFTLVTNERRSAVHSFPDHYFDPEICHGKPTIRGLRYPVESILESLTAGDTFEELLAEFPDLEREDLQACLEFATQSLKLKSRHLVLQ